MYNKNGVIHKDKKYETSGSARQSRGLEWRVLLVNRQSHPPPVTPTASHTNRKSKR